MILVTYRHGLRASEVCDLQWHQVELDQGRMHVRRAKNGTPSVHPIRGDEIRALRKLRRESPTEAYVFVTERGGPMSTIGFHHQRLGKAAQGTVYRRVFPILTSTCQSRPRSSTGTRGMHHQDASYWRSAQTSMRPFGPRSTTFATQGMSPLFRSRGTIAEMVSEAGRVAEFISGALASPLRAALVRRAPRARPAPASRHICRASPRWAASPEPRRSLAG